jgi:HSP20 family protein
MLLKEDMVMGVMDLIPRTFGRPLTSRFSEDTDPFFALHRNMSRLIDDFARGFGMPTGLWGAGPMAFSGNWPRVEVSDSSAEMKVVADLPGLEEKDIKLSLQEGVLTLKGEKTQETKDALYSERWHGQFQRSIPVGNAVDPNKVSATFKNGVLTVTLGKRPEAQEQVKHIPISQG